MTTTSQSPTAEKTETKYKDLYSQIGPVPMVLANSAESHVECNEPLYEALNEYNRNYYGEMLIEYFHSGFLHDDEYTKELKEYEGLTVNEVLIKSDNEEYTYMIEEYINDSDYVDIYQTYITDESGAELFSDYGYPTWYNEDMDLHFVGITHYGTAWSYVMNSQYPVHNKERYTV